MSSVSLVCVTVTLVATSWISLIVLVIKANDSAMSVYYETDCYSMDSVDSCTQIPACEWDSDSHFCAQSSIEHESETSLRFNAHRSGNPCNNCNKFAMCTKNNAGNFQCICFNGYSGDGDSCDRHDVNGASFVEKTVLNTSRTPREIQSTMPKRMNSSVNSLTQNPDVRDQYQSCNRCHRHANCIFDDLTDLRKISCVCIGGYYGDGFNCTQMSTTQHPVDNSTISGDVYLDQNYSGNQGIVFETIPRHISRHSTIWPSNFSIRCVDRRDYASDLHTSSRYAIVLQEMNRDSTEILKLAMSKARNGSIILTFASFSYRTALFNWLHSAAMVGISNIVIVSTDVEVKLFLDNRSIPNYFNAGEAERIANAFSVHGKLSKVWSHRYVLIHALLRANLHVLQCDVDALFLKDPSNLLNNIRGDVVAQRGNFPTNVARAWGSAMCFGFILYRSTRATLSWFLLSLPEFCENPDDQVAFQRALRKCSKIQWNTKRKPTTFGKDAERIDYGITDSAIDSEGSVLQIALLSSSEFPRRCGLDVGAPEKKPNCYLAHCISAKSGSSKVLDAKKRGLHFLDRAWENVQKFKNDTWIKYVRKLGNGRHPLHVAVARSNFVDDAPLTVFPEPRLETMQGSKFKARKMQ